MAGIGPLPANQASRTLPVESQNPIPNGLEPDAPDPRRIRPRAAVIDLCKGQKTTPLRRVLRRLRLTPQTSGIEISSQRNRDAHGGPPCPPHIDSEVSRFAYPHESHSAPAGISLCSSTRYAIYRAIYLAGRAASAPTFSPRELFTEINKILNRGAAVKA